MTYYEVSGSSMSPVLKDGDMVVVNPYYKFNLLKSGDIVVYQNSSGIHIIHALVRKVIRKKRRYIFFGPVVSTSIYWEIKGYNNRKKDKDVVTEKNYKGCVSYPVALL